jgi:hypothetical protein
MKQAIEADDQPIVEALLRFFETSAALKDALIWTINNKRSNLTDALLARASWSVADLRVALKQAVAQNNRYAVDRVFARPCQGTWTKDDLKGPLAWAVKNQYMGTIKRLLPLTVWNSQDLKSGLELAVQGKSRRCIKALMNAQMNDSWNIKYLQGLRDKASAQGYEKAAKVLKKVCETMHGV